MHVKRGLGKNESTGIRDTRVLDSGETKFGGIICCVTRTGISSPPLASCGVNVGGTSIIEKTVGIDERLRSLSNGFGSSERVDGIGKSINGISVVEGLGTKSVVKGLSTLKRRAVINVLVRLNNPNKLLNGVVKVELDLVTGRTDRLVTSELKLLNEVLVGVLGHSAALIGIQEDIVNIEGSGNKRLVVGSGDLTRTRASGAVKSTNSPQALINGADVKVDLDLVVLKSNQRKGKTGVTAVPELKRNVKSSLGKSITGSTHLARSVRLTRSINLVERGVGDEGKLGGVTNHLVVSALLLGCKSKLVPDVHPVTILTVDSLATNLNLNLRDELLTGEIQPTGINTILGGTRGINHLLVDLGESNLKISTVAKITVSADGACNTASEIGLAVECLLNGLHCEVSMASVRDFPESNLRVTRKIDILGSVSYELH